MPRPSNKALAARVEELEQALANASHEVGQLEDRNMELEERIKELTAQNTLLRELLGNPGTAQTFHINNPMTVNVGSAGEIWDDTDKAGAVASAGTKKK